ncbi:hypothetical protein RRG08_016302 [Elysia crispata]|uniref:G-protein coupled receptors family 1 profile domain-containing protein n=1 Tax=Elysia crispata TaxID=231223 RepID=A0AAE1DMU2_9GAST|nr:hypothetical protein RRG08_016302 [Elysia crispata]
MSVDRYMAILRPMRPKMSRKAFITIMTTIWILSFSVPLPTALTSRVTYNKGFMGDDSYFDSNSSSFNTGSNGSSSSSSSGGSNNISSYNGSDSRLDRNFSGGAGLVEPVLHEDSFGGNEKGLCLEVFENEQHRYIYSVMIMMLQYFVPLAVITVTNCHIGYIVWIKKTPGEAEVDRDRRMAASKRRLVKMIIIVVVIYAVCWLPLHVITVVGDHNPDIYSLPHMNVVWLCAHWLAMSHSCYNPIVYFSLNTTFRRNLKRMMLICRTSVRRHYRNRKRRGRSGFNNNGNNMGSASSLQHNGGLGTGGTSGGGDWTISGDMDDEETMFVDQPFDSRNGINRNSRIGQSNSIRSGKGFHGVNSIRGSMISQADWKHMANTSRKSRKKDAYM